MHTSMTKESLLKRVFDKDPVLIIAGPLQSGKTTQTQLFKESFKQLHPQKDLFTVSLEEELEKELPNFPPWAIKKIKEVKDIGGSQPVCIESIDTSVFIPNTASVTSFVFNFSSAPES